MTRNKIRYLTGSAVCAFVGMFATPAMAQDGPNATPGADAAQPEGAPAVQTAQPADAENSNEVIVQAQRRAQRLQDVPIAVTALTGEQIEHQGLTSTHDLAQAVTGLTILEAGGYVQPFIRGVGSTVTNLGEQGSAATYIDGVYMPTVNGQLYELANLQSIEVLKGPQGTLFGRNANTGAIIITTRQPQFTPEGRFQIGYGNFNAVSAQGFLTGPLSEGIAVSVAGNYDRHDGWFNNLFNGDDEFGDAERWAVRANILINAAPNFSITLSGDAQHTDDASPILVQPITGYQGFVPGGLLPRGPYDFIGNGDGTGNVGYIARQEGMSARLRWDTGPVEVISTTAYRWFYTHAIDYDSDTTPFLLARINNLEKGTNFTQELQLNSSGSGPFTWVVGAFYLRQDADYAPLIVTSPAGPTTITAQQVTQAYAGFADASYNFGNFEITGGLRYSYETKRYNGQRNGVQLVNNAHDNWDALTPRVVLSYHPNRRVLLYASYSQGFKSGTFNANGLSSTPVNPETVDAYEIGLKLTPQPNMVLNISAFQYNIDDLQVQALNPATNLILVANAAQVRARGVDVEFSVRPIEGLNLRLSGSYLDAVFTDFPNAQVFIRNPAFTDGRNLSVIRDVTGNQNVRSPKWTFNVAADYRIRLANGGSFVPSANLYYSSSFFWEVGNRLREDPHFIANANLTYNFPGDRFSITAWVRNLTDEVRSRNTQAAAQADRRVSDEPRVFGLRLGYQF